MDDIKADTEERGAEERGREGGKDSVVKGGKSGTTAEGGKMASGRECLAIPRGVVDEGVRITRETLELVCEVVE